MTSKYGLALHTTTPELGLAIGSIDINKVLSYPPEIIMRSQVWDLQRQVSNLLHECLLEFIPPQTWSDLGLIAVAAGPGGFTGTRIGVVAARTLGQQLKIPVFAISTLAAYAWQIYQNSDGKYSYIAVQMPAQRGQLFGAIYHLNANKPQISLVLPDTVFMPQIWEEKLSNFPEKYHLVEAKSGLAATVTSILTLACFEYGQGKRPDWSQAMPFYGQNPV